MNKVLAPLFLTAAVCCTVGGVRLTKKSAAAEAAPEPGQIIMNLKDINGVMRELPVWYDGENYLLADYTRNIFVHNGFSASTLEDVMGGVKSYPVYSSADGNFSDGMAVSLYSNMIEAYDFYCKENIGVDYFGITGKNDNIAGNWEANPDEVPLHAFVHFNAGSYRYNAAFLYERNTGFMIVGDGDAKNTTYNMYRQGASLDIIAHEYQHGITRFLNEGLKYESDSGAMDEAFADIFGMLVSEEDMTSEKFWSIGEESTINHTATRRIDHPTQSGDGYYRETVPTRHQCSIHSFQHNAECDYNFVHYNSTVVSHVQYSAWEIAPESFNRQTTAKLWFNTLKGLKSDATYQDFSTQIRSVARNLKLDKAAINALDYSLFINGFIEDEMHKITLLDEEDHVLGYSAVPHGGSAADILPQFKDSDQYEYNFQSWDVDLQVVTEDLTVHAIYEKKLKNYTVTFQYEDGTLIEKIVLPYGSELKYPEQNPEKKASKEFTYQFVGWNGVVDVVKKDITVTAMFDEIPQKSNVLPIVLGCVGGGVVVVGGIVAFLLLRKKKKAE